MHSINAPDDRIYCQNCNLKTISVYQTALCLANKPKHIENNFFIYIYIFQKCTDIDIIGNKKLLNI